MSTQTVTTYYESDHDRLDELFNKFQQLKRIDFPKAKEFFQEFKFGLQRHIVWEEEILFPLFEQKTGMYDQGPTEVMRQEHRLIKKYLEAMHEKVKACNPESNDEEQLLLNTLSMHNQKEEQILYPAIDHSLSDHERETVFTSMKTIPEERYWYCCTPDIEKKRYFPFRRH
ncbi:MAG: hemerythrin domain-containing protein [Ignavibacteriae bacterium]|nr:hemerythrin domain-containing protein [Ignavibacteriota bacterium]